MPTTPPLHLKYRPQTLEFLVGQPDVQTTLSNAVKRNRIPPAILLIGPKGTGKTSTARIFAKSINCLSDRPTLNPCGKCESCRSIESSISLDVTEMDAASHGGVDDARELIQRIQIAPVKGAYRVVILDEAQMLTREAQNALLKTFEEPPSHVVFILCTTDPHKILPTIVSRCLTLTFRSLAIDTVCNHLKHIADQEAIAITSDAIRAIARICDGGMRDALQTLGKASLSEEATAQDILQMMGGITSRELVTLIKAITQKDIITLLTSSQALLDNGKEPHLILNGLLQTYRDLLLLKTTNAPAALLTSPVEPTKLRKIADVWSVERLTQDLDQLYKREGQLGRTNNPRLWLEVSLMNLIAGFAVPEPQTTSAHQSINLAEVWQQVKGKAKPESQPLLDQAVLVEVSPTKAVLKVSRKSRTRIEAKAEKLGSLIASVIGAPAPVVVTIQEA